MRFVSILNATPQSALVTVLSVFSAIPFAAVLNTLVIALISSSVFVAKSIFSIDSYMMSNGILLVEFSPV